MHKSRRLRRYRETPSQQYTSIDNHLRIVLRQNSDMAMQIYLLTESLREFKTGRA